MRKEPSESFEERFAAAAGVLLRAIARRRDRAEKRWGALYRPDWEGGITGKHAVEREQWGELRDAYSKAHDSVLAALHWVRWAREVLRRVGR